MQKKLNCKDGILGLAIGDALGVPVEFLDRKYLQKNPVTDLIEDKINDLPKGTWSDDTSMTIATMDSINQSNSINIDDIIQKFISWMDKDEYTATGECFDVGDTVYRALSNYKINGIQNTYHGENGENSNGNGSLMRILPIAYFIKQNNISDENEILNIVREVSSITHSHEVSILSCYIYVQFACKLLEGKNRNEAYKYIQEIDYSKFKPETLDTFSRIIKSDIRNLTEDEIKSSGYTVDTLEAALWVYMNSNDYNNAILKAVNLGDDTDTVAAVTGGLLGIEYGVESINQNWINGLQNIEFITDICNKFNETTKQSLLASSKSYSDKLKLQYDTISSEITKAISLNKRMKASGQNQKSDFER
jgi:ADP-ribosylglycohydrolase